MTAKEWLEVIKQAEDYNPKITSLIEKYGELLLSENNDSGFNSEDMEQSMRYGYTLAANGNKFSDSLTEFKKYLAQFKTKQP